MEKRERSMSVYFRHVSQRAICWILTVMILSAPLVSCNLAFNSPVVVSAPTILTGNEEISTAEKDSAKSAVVNVVDFKSIETIETKEQRIIVEVDVSKSGFVIPEDSEREHFRSVFPNLSRVTSDSDETIIETINGLDFILDTKILFLK